MAAADERRVLLEPASAELHGAGAEGAECAGAVEEERRLRTAGRQCLAHWRFAYERVQADGGPVLQPDLLELASLQCSGSRIAHGRRGYVGGRTSPSAADQSR